MDQAQKIAGKINQVVDATLLGTMTAEDCRTQTQALWQEAATLGVTQEVDDILQAQSIEEMDQAIREAEINLNG